jgi:hypothetical protein
MEPTTILKLPAQRLPASTLHDPVVLTVWTFFVLVFCLALGRKIRGSGDKLKGFSGVQNGALVLFV